jgi:hypothetical protein
VVAIALAGGGACWILALSTLNTLYQLSLPSWVKARGMSFYLVVFQGGSAVGSAVMGVSAQYAGLSVTLLIAAIGLAAGPLAALRWRFQIIAPADLQPAGDWPAPLLASDAAGTGPGRGRAGPHRSGRSRSPSCTTRSPAGSRTCWPRSGRRRTGANSWRAWQDATDPGRILEQFVVSSWAEHERQHQRVT